MNDDAEPKRTIARLAWRVFIGIGVVCVAILAFPWLFYAFVVLDNQRERASAPPVKLSACAHSIDIPRRSNAFSAVVDNGTRVAINAVEIGYDIVGFTNVTFQHRIAPGSSAKVSFAYRYRDATDMKQLRAGIAQGTAGIGERPCELWTVWYADGSVWKRQRNAWP